MYTQKKKVRESEQWVKLPLLGSRCGGGGYVNDVVVENGNEKKRKMHDL